MIVFMWWVLIMLKYRRIYELDDELYDFHLRQKQYYLLEGTVPTKEYLIEQMDNPEGFDEKDHYIKKIYYNEKMVALIDYQIGYRFSMKHDNSCLWIGLFLVDESWQRKGIGKEIMEFMIDEYKEICSTVQLACIKENLKGLCFWEKLGFKEIDVKRCGNLEVRVLEKRI